MTELGKVSEIESPTRLGLAAKLDQAELGFILRNIVHQGVQKPLRMLGSHYDPVTDVGLGESRQHCGEINDEFAV